MQLCLLPVPLPPPLHRHHLLVRVATLALSNEWTSEFTSMMLRDRWPRRYRHDIVMVAVVSDVGVGHICVVCYYYHCHVTLLLIAIRGLSMIASSTQ